MSDDRPVTDLSATVLGARLADARAQLLALADRLPPEGWLGPRAEHLNPPLWELGHIAWFQERWCLRAQADGRFAASRLATADALYDSSTVAHDTRWDLPLLAPPAVCDYATGVLEDVCTQLASAFTPARAYFAELSLYHELMHVEAWRMAFQNLGYALPQGTPRLGIAPNQARLACPGGMVVLGSGADTGFIFDNEKWTHTVEVAPFEIDASLMTETAFAAFVDAGGYGLDAVWSEAGRAWREAAQATHPLYWRRGNDGWQVREFDTWRVPGAQTTLLHVNRHEAEACAHWLGRELPSAAQWVHGTTQPGSHWGAAWEWTRDAFGPYPGFSPDPYADYSAPWFHTHAELRGGGPYTDAALRRPGFRNFYLPHRRDPFAGFRTVSRV